MESMWRLALSTRSPPPLERAGREEGPGGKDRNDLARKPEPHGNVARALEPIEKGRIRQVEDPAVPGLG